MSSIDRIPRSVWERFRKDQSGSAVTELVIASSVFVSLAVTASDMGAMLAAGTRLDAAARDAARTLSLAPRDAEGALLEDGVGIALSKFYQRISEAGVDLALVPSPPEDATCTEDGAFCHRIDEIPGSAEALGETRHTVTVWAAAEIDTDLIDILLPDAGVDGVLLTSAFAQMHYR